MSTENNNTVEIDEAKFRRGMAALRQFSQNKRKQLNASSSNNAENKPNSSVSMRYNPFSQILFSRKRTGIEEIYVTDDDDDNHDDRDETKEKKKSLILFDIVDYLHVPSKLKLPSLMERNEASAATVADFKASRLGQVDNTGSFHWPAEDILAHLLLLLGQNGEPQNSSSGSSSPSLSSSFLFDWSDRPSVLEIGAGVGLAGFALAMSGRSKHVVVTDGNWRVAKLLGKNAERVSVALPDDKTKITAGCLPWQIFSVDEGDDGDKKNEGENLEKQKSEDKKPIMKYGNILNECQYLVGADCLFFESFHKDLVNLVLRFFFPSNNVISNPNKKVVFVAPSRGGSRERFLEMLRKNLEQKTFGAFSGGESSSSSSDHNLLPLTWEIIENYDQDVFNIHQSHCLDEIAQSKRGYTTDRHYPQVVVISYTRKN